MTPRAWWLTAVEAGMAVWMGSVAVIGVVSLDEPGYGMEYGAPYVVIGLVGAVAMLVDMVRPTRGSLLVTTWAITMSAVASLVHGVAIVLVDPVSIPGWRIVVAPLMMAGYAPLLVIARSWVSIQATARAVAGRGLS